MATGGGCRRWLIGPIDEIGRTDPTTAVVPVEMARPAAGDRRAVGRRAVGRRAGEARPIAVVLRTEATRAAGGTLVMTSVPGSAGAPAGTAVHRRGSAVLVRPIAAGPRSVVGRARRAAAASRTRPAVGAAATRAAVVARTRPTDPPGPPDPTTAGSHGMRIAIGRPTAPGHTIMEPGPTRPRVRIALARRTGTGVGIVRPATDAGITRLTADRAPGIGVRPEAHHPEDRADRAVGGSARAHRLEARVDRVARGTGPVHSRTGASVPGLVRTDEDRRDRGPTGGRRTNRRRSRHSTLLMSSARLRSSSLVGVRSRRHSPPGVRRSGCSSCPLVATPSSGWSCMRPASGSRSSRWKAGR